MKYYSDLGKALMAMDQSTEPRMKIKRRGPHEATFHESFEQYDDTVYVDAQAKYMASDVEYEEAKVAIPDVRAHFDSQAEQLDVTEVSQKKEPSYDQSDSPDYYEILPDSSSQLDPYNMAVNAQLTNMRANVPVDEGNGAELLMDNLNQAADNAQALMTDVQNQLAPVVSAAAAQTPGIVKTIQSKDLATAAAFSGLAWALIPSFVPGGKYVPLAIMAIWAMGQNKKA